MTGQNDLDGPMHSMDLDSYAQAVERAGIPRHLALSELDCATVQELHEQLIRIKEKFDEILERTPAGADRDVLHLVCIELAEINDVKLVHFT